MSADHKKPSYAFAGLVVLAASVVGIQVRADADLSEQAIASHTVLQAVLPARALSPGRESAGPTSARATGQVTLDGLGASPWGPGSPSSSASTDADASGGAGLAAGRHSDRAVATSRSGARAHAHDDKARTRKGRHAGSARAGLGGDEHHGPSADRGWSGDDRRASGHGAGPRHRGHTHDRGRGHR